MVGSILFIFLMCCCMQSVALKYNSVALVIVVAHGGLKLTFHSLHDGSVLKTLPLNLPDVDGVERRLVSDLWWLKQTIKERPEAFQDVLNRKETVGPYLLIAIAS